MPYHHHYPILLQVLRDTGDVNSAIDDYNKVVTTDTKNWKGFHERAVCWHLKGMIYMYEYC